MKRRDTVISPATGEVLWWGVPPLGTRPQWVSLQAGVRTDSAPDALNGTLVVEGGKLQQWQNGKLVTIGTYTPATPIVVSASVSGATATVSWPATGASTFYDIVLDAVYMGRTAALVYSLPGLSAGSHVVSVTASNGQTGAKTFDVSAVAPPAPASLTAVATGPNTASVNWSPNPATDYRNTEVLVNGVLAASAAQGPVVVTASGTVTITARAVAETGLVSAYSSVTLTMPTEKVPTGATASSTVAGRTPGLAADSNTATAWLAQQYTTDGGYDWWQGNVTGNMLSVRIWTPTAQNAIISVNGVQRNAQGLSPNVWNDIACNVPGATTLRVSLQPVVVPGYPGLRSVLAEVHYYS